MRCPDGRGLMGDEETIAEIPATATAAVPVKGKSNQVGVRLIFEETSPGRSGFDLRHDDDSDRRAREMVGNECCRADIEDFPELSEPQVLRHFLQLSQMNFGQALHFYPLGSCTMKYNPAVNDELAGLGGFAA